MYLFVIYIIWLLKNETMYGAITNLVINENHIIGELFGKNLVLTKFYYRLFYSVANS